MKLLSKKSVWRTGGACIECLDCDPTNGPTRGLWTAPWVPREYPVSTRGVPREYPVLHQARQHAHRLAEKSAHSRVPAPHRAGGRALTGTIRRRSQGYYEEGSTVLYGYSHGPSHTSALTMD
jgi:hypothetical protein